MKPLYQFLILSLSVAGLTGCKKYVDIKTQGNLVPSQTINYRYLLNNNQALEATASLSDFASSDINFTDADQIAGLTSSSYYSQFVKAYSWQNNIYILGSTDENDYNWAVLYTRILYCNTIINELPASNGTAAEKAALTAEALVHRADAYFTLVNTYAKPYNASTAATDLGVPLLLEQTVSQRLNRATVQVIYNQIISDLTTAVGSLPATQQMNTLPSKPSAYGELARCYTYMHDYTNAARYADMALASRNTIVDLSGMDQSTMYTYPTRFVNPEILLSELPQSGAASYSPLIFKLSNEYLALLGTADQRFTLFTSDASNVSSTYTGRFFTKEAATGQTRNEGPSVPEMMLIKAEAFARAGDVGSAMEWVNNLRVKRFKAADYEAMTASSPNDALVKVIDERRREFYGTSLRWWDMRRLKDESLFQRSYTRFFNGVTYTLEPNSDRYVFPIAAKLSQLNPELEPNP
ncbi:RagB/SusD family nutrient uptake outer membrane protein [Pedobacter sp. AW31-3R]|uniref:RagB/SusD family nutrient uptake outer membrane protein n=1 Tax=Pedobacter sp. AW31-3R TaxID=3445781 RepID=UPI003FA0FCBE